ncbi:MAG: DMT family transporter [Candidatus Micrarchaeota archaeon]
MGKKLSLRDWGSALIAFLGLALITYRPGLEFNPGDLLTFGCAIAFALDVIFTGEFIKRRSLVPLTLAQFGTVAILSTALAGLAGPRLETEAIPAILFLALFATLLALVVQAWAQKKIAQVTAGVIFSLEPVFAALFSYIIIGELFSGIQLVGSGLIFGAILVSSVKGKS